MTTHKELREKFETYAKEVTDNFEYLCTSNSKRYLHLDSEMTKDMLKFKSRIATLLKRLKSREMICEDGCEAKWFQSEKQKIANEFLLKYMISFELFVKRMEDINL